MAKGKKRTFSVGDDPDPVSVGDDLTLSKKRKAKTQAMSVSNTQPESLPVNTIDSTISINVDSCLEMIRSLNDKVSTLERHVEFLLSCFGVSTCTANINSNDTQSTQARSFRDVVADHSTHGVGAGGATVSKVNPVLSSSMRQAVVTAMYSDMHSQARRSANLVVTGLPPDRTISDKEAVVNLFRDELHCDHYDPFIVKYRRLGVSKSNKVQPLLITFTSDDHAGHIYSKAKSLRHSGDERVRQHVFINRDLTKAQAAAEYHARCQRRAVQASRSTRPTGGDSLTHATTSSSTGPPRSAASLSATAPRFEPSTGSAPAVMVPVPLMSSIPTFTQPMVGPTSLALSTPMALTQQHVPDTLYGPHGIPSRFDCLSHMQASNFTTHIPPSHISVVPTPYGCAYPPLPLSAMVPMPSGPIPGPTSGTRPVPPPTAVTTA
jgi:hypothetical protein